MMCQNKQTKGILKKQILEREEESRKLREEINKDPAKWLNIQVAWWNKNRYRDRAGDIIDGKLEDAGFYGGVR